MMMSNQRVANKSCVGRFSNMFGHVYIEIASNY